MGTRHTTSGGLGAVLLGLALAGSVAAQGIAPVDRGWYGDDGTVGNAYGYTAGNCTTCATTNHRNWFVFDLGCVPDTITSAALTIEMPVGGYLSVDATETYELFDVVTTPAVLMGGVGGTAAFDDLGLGTSLGSAQVSFADEGLEVTIPLNPDGLAYLNAGLGGVVAIGGAVTSLDGDPTTQERVFANSIDWAVRLVVTPGCNVRDAFDRGWYQEMGTHFTNNVNYIVGNCPSCLGGEVYRNFFAFNVSGLGGLVTGATLALEQPYGPATGDPSETYVLYEVTTPQDTLLDGTAGIPAFDDLGDGTVYGTHVIGASDGASLVQIPLAANGLVALNEAGSKLVIGGALTTLDGDPGTTEVSFGSNVPVHGITQMFFEVEPQWSWLGGGTEGALGKPLLLGFGPLTSGSLASVSLTNAPPSALVLAWFSLAPTPFAALDGTVHAFPFLNQFLFATDPTGSFSGGTTWPAGIPPGTNAWFQFIVQDASSIHGLTLSNGLLATTP